MTGCSCRPCKPKWQKFTEKAISNNRDADHLISYIVFHKDKTEKVVIHVHNRIVRDLNKRYSGSLTIGNCVHILKEIMAKGNIHDFNFGYILKSSIALLETNDYAYKKMGCDIFESFCRLHQNTIACYLEYPTLLQHFKEMALSTNVDRNERIHSRIAGINGVHGLVKIVANENSRGNVITSELPSIISVLLTNIYYSNVEEGVDEVANEAQMTFRTVLYRTPRNELPFLVDSILKFLDDQPAWNNSDFVEKIFTLYIESLNNSDNGLLKKLIHHLEEKKDIDIRIGVVKSIPKITDIISHEVIGPEVLLNFKNLISSLLNSIRYTEEYLKKEDSNSNTLYAKERAYQEQACSAILKYSSILTDHQKTIILRVICDELVNYFPRQLMHYTCQIKSRLNVHEVYSVPFIRILMKIMFCIVGQYSNVSISNGLDSELFQILLNKVALANDPGIRLYVHRILHVFIDQKQTIKPKVKLVRTYSTSTLSQFEIEEPNIEDVLFMKKSGNLLTQNIYLQLLEPINRVDNFEHLNCTICLLALKINSEEVISELFRLILQVQDKAVEYSRSEKSFLPVTHQCAIHSVVSSCATILAFLIKNDRLSEHVANVIVKRKESCSYLLPDVAFNRSNTKDSYPTNLDIPDDCLFNRSIIKENLSQSDYPVNEFDKEYCGTVSYPCKIPHDMFDGKHYHEELPTDTIAVSNSSQTESGFNINTGKPIIDDFRTSATLNMPRPIFADDRESHCALSLIDPKDDNESNRSSQNSIELFLKNYSTIENISESKPLIKSSDLLDFSGKIDPVNTKARLHEVHDNINAEFQYQIKCQNTTNAPISNISNFTNAPFKEWQNKLRDFKEGSVKSNQASQLSSKDPELEIIDEAIRKFNSSRNKSMNNPLIDSTMMI